MSGGITKECFPPASECHNCKRKGRAGITEKTNGEKVFLRCSQCHLLTYCDKDCQREHWEKVHKRHCKFLAGRKQLENSRHRKDSCELCFDENNATASEMRDIKSHKTVCHIEFVIKAMKKALGIYFGFHEERKTCSCSHDFPAHRGCELPFTLGEISGKYIGKGLDGMLAHAVKIVSALCMKERLDTGGKNETLLQLLGSLISSRSAHWGAILIAGIPESLEYDKVQKHLSEPVKEELKVYFGPTNAWWKALKFSVENIVNTNGYLNSEPIDAKSLENPMYSNMKLMHDYDQSQTRNQVYVEENNLWSKFKLWPSLSGGSLVILLPEGTLCQSCNCTLSSGDRARPKIMSGVGQNGAMVAFCKNLKCLTDFTTKDVKLSAQRDEDKWKEIVEECKTFHVQSRACDMCLKQSLFSHRCSECYAAQYCSNQCQVEDFKFHKTVCSTWAKDKSRKIINSKNQKKIYQSNIDKYSARV